MSAEKSEGTRSILIQYPYSVAVFQPEIGTGAESEGMLGLCLVSPEQKLYSQGGQVRG